MIYSRDFAQNLKNGMHVPELLFGDPMRPTNGNTNMPIS